jgi:hypothetical protein
MTTQKVKFGRSQADAVIHAPIDKVNIGEWMFTLASEDYAACADGHQSCALGALPDGTRVCVNIESVGGVFMVQNYLETVSEPDHVLGVSANSAMWTPDGEQFTVEVHWDLRAERLSDQTTKLICTVELFSSDENLNAAFSDATFRSHSEETLRLHVEEEAPLFAKDIERKAQAGVWSGTKN